MEPKTKNQVAEKLLWALWRSIDEGYKDRYKMEIWTHFENALRSAAYCSTLTTFLTNYRARIPMTLQSQFVQQVDEIIHAPNQKEILNWLRDETMYLVLLVRVDAQDRRAAYESKTGKQ